MTAVQGHMFMKMKSYLKNSLTITFKTKNDKTYDNTFKTNIYRKQIKSVAQANFTLLNDTFFF